MPYVLDLSEKKKYYRLMAEVCDLIPPSAVDKLVREGYPLAASSLSMVRHGRQMNLPALVALVRVAAPDFVIPEDLLPAEPASY